MHSEQNLRLSAQRSDAQIWFIGRQVPSSIKSHETRCENETLEQSIARIEFERIKVVVEGG